MITYSVKYLIDDEQQKRLEALAVLLNSKTDEQGNKLFSEWTAESVFESMMTLGSKGTINERLDTYERLSK